MEKKKAVEAEKFRTMMLEAQGLPVNPAPIVVRKKGISQRFSEYLNNQDEATTAYQTAVTENQKLLEKAISEDSELMELEDE